MLEREKRPVVPGSVSWKRVQFRLKHQAEEGTEESSVELRTRRTVVARSGAERPSAKPGERPWGPNAGLIRGVKQK